MADEQTPYWKQVVLVAPAFGAKTLISDLPKGVVEHVVESKAGGSKASLRSLIRQGGSGRGGGRALGGALGILTAPLYLKGLQMAGSKSKDERLKGYGLIAGSGGVSVAQKGLVEGYRAGRVAGTKAPRALAEGARLGLFRAGYKAPLAVLMASSLVKRDKDQTARSRFLRPALTGGLIGGAGRGAESLLAQQAGARTLRKALPAVAGGAASGVLGGLVLGGAVDLATKLLRKSKEKKAMHPFAPILAHVPGDLRQDVEGWLVSKLESIG